MFFGLMIAFAMLVCWGIFLFRVIYLSDDFHVPRIWTVRNCCLFWLANTGVMTWSILVQAGTPSGWQFALQVALTMYILGLISLMMLIWGILSGLYLLLEERARVKRTAGKQPWLMSYMTKHFQAK